MLYRNLKVARSEKAELVKILQTLIARINQFIQTPEPECLLPLIGDELKAKYSTELITEVVYELIWSEFPALSHKFTQLFDKFNAEYFDNKLPRCEVEVRNAISYHQTASVYCGLHNGISILFATEPRMVWRLLAEMCRLETGDVYDEKWNDAMGRLANRVGGNPIAEIRPADRDISAQFIESNIKPEEEIRYPGSSLETPDKAA